MNQQIYNYFKSAQIQTAATIFNNRTNHQNNILISSSDSSNVQKVTINSNQAYFLKQTDIAQGLAAAAAATMYQNIGIATPPVQIVDDINNLNIQTLQPSVENISDFETILAAQDLEYVNLKKEFFGKFKWHIFYDKNLTNYLLKFMTPACLEELKNMFLLDEIRTDIDRHPKNYFFYKNKNSQKYEGIIVIDLEQMVIYNYCLSSKDDFSNFLLYPYESATPQQVTDYKCYKDRVVELQELIQSGKLSEENINILKAALSYDYPKELKHLCKSQKLSRREKNNIVSPIERLWEYNNQTIGKELEL